MVKRCSTCKNELPLSSFGANKATQDGLQNECRHCRMVRALDGRKRRERLTGAELKENKRRQNVRYRERNKAALTERKKAYAQANKANETSRSRTWAQANKARVSERNRKWKEANRAAIVAQEHRRRARKASAGGSYTAKEWADLCVQYANKCLCCARSNRKLTVDHVIPVSQGGSSNIGNLQPLCGPCNSAKGDKHIDYRP